MPRFLPTTELDLLNFARSHADLWVERADELGLSPQSAQRQKDEADELAAAWGALQEAELALRAARDRFNRADGGYRAAASSCIRAIKAFAVGVGNPAALFIAADLPAPKRSDRNRAVGEIEWKPARIDPVSGAVTIEWRGNTPRSVSGTVYCIRRRAPGGVWSDLGHVSRPRFVDASDLSGHAEIEYQVTPRRASIIGEPSVPLVVRK